MIEVCESCGAKIIKYRHRLNKPLVSALIKMYAQYRLNEARISQVLSHTQVCNFQKLQYWGLVVKVKKEGNWRLTTEAEDFIKHKIAIPEWVETFRRKVMQVANKCVFVNEIFEGYQWREDYLNSENLM
jgi:hypothetical protein